MANSPAKQPPWRKVGLALLLVLLAYLAQRFGLWEGAAPTPGAPPTNPAPSPRTSSDGGRSRADPDSKPRPGFDNPRPEAQAQVVRDGGIPALFAAGKSDVWVEADSVILKLLSDDMDGSRHQRWIARIGPSLTVLFAHNIDVAPRVPLQPGDTISFRGEYIWKDQGGTIHWTHRADDPRKPGGWIRWKSNTYE